MLETLTAIFLEVARRVDGATLVQRALVAEPETLGHGPLHVLAFGKVAFPMFDGLRRAVGDDRLAGALLVAPQTRFPSEPRLPSNFTALASDHPDPSERSVTAGRAARDFVAALSPSARLVVLISGGGSSALALPAGDLSLEDKRGAAKAVARAGASIAELNAVRKHLSAIKGGQLALLTRAPTVVLALSDVVGNDPGTIASGPFSPDPSTFEKALAVVEPLAGQIPAWALDHLHRGAAGELGETPKPGDPRLAHVDYRVLAGPERVADEARRIVASERRTAGALSSNTERSVPDLAKAYGERARLEVATGGPPRVLVGNGEPTIVVAGQGRGGRATHLALMMAREISGLADVAFLAAGTDDRDGSSDASGAVVDGATWERAESRGLDPSGALSRCDSETPLAALGCLVRGPGTSNLLDLHLLAIGS
jgi:hydroxypyruvate reductase